VNTAGGHIVNAAVAEALGQTPVDVHVALSTGL
jgi:hypothetical protein